MNRIINSDDLNWDFYLEQMPLHKRDIYYTREYYRMYESNGDGIAKLFVFQESEKLALYPFLLNEIVGYNLQKKYFDIEAVYGYGGPLVSDELDSEFVKHFEESFLFYCKQTNIVAEFIRFNPYLKNENIFTKRISVIHNRSTVYLDLKKSLAEIWNQDISSKNRNMIRKAEKNNLRVEINENFHEFRKLYEATMKKVSATQYYYFKDAYYEEMSASKYFSVINIKKENTVIAAAIFMHYDLYIHYHLAGSNQEYLGLAPNNLLLWEAIKYAKLLQCQVFHFGGGLSDDKEDSLYKFKSSFSKDSLDFYIGKRIHNNDIYSYLIEEWEKRSHLKAKLFLQYRS